MIASPRGVLQRTNLHVRVTGPAACLVVLAAHPGAFASSPCSPTSSSPIVDAAVARFPAAPELETGALGDAVIGKLVEATCTDAARPSLPSTCASPGPSGMADLRRRLLGDIARLPAAALARSGDADAQTGVRVGLAAVEALLGDGSLGTVARALAGETCGAAPSTDGDLARTGRLLARLAAAPPSDDRDEPARRIEAALAEEGLIEPGEALSPTRRDAAKALADALARGAGAPAIRRAFDAAQASVALVKDAKVALPTGWIEGIVALAEGDASAAAEAQITVLKGMGVTSTAAAAEALRTGVRLASSRSREDALRVLRGTLLGPWTDPFLLDLSLVMPVISRENVTFGGHAAVGYVGRRFGARAHGGFETYNLDDGRAISQVNKASGGSDLWFTIGSGATRFDARFTAELALYGTTVIDRGDGSGKTFGHESALDYRGSAILGLRHEPNARFALGIWAGGGLQYEFHAPLKLTTDDPSLDLAQTHAASLLLQSRVRAQYLLVPGWLALRLQSDLQRNAKVSAALGLQADAMGLRIAASAARATQIEWRWRLFLDAEVARFWGMVPGVTAGFDFVSLSAERSASTVVPVFGVGIRRTAL